MAFCVLTPCSLVGGYHIQKNILPYLQDSVRLCRHVANQFVFQKQGGGGSGGSRGSLTGTVSGARAPFRATVLFFITRGILNCEKSGGCMFLCNVSSPPPYYMVSQPRILQSEQTPPWKPRNFIFVHAK
jgi:hypothetical protein